jgi:thiol:disulfide interchange protein
MRVAPALFAAVALAATPALAMTPPVIASALSIDHIDVPSRPFSSDANADADVDAAFAQAKAEHKLVLIDLGANWCADCRILEGVFELPDVKVFLDAHYVLVRVDVGRLNRNLQIPARFGITERLQAVPCLLVSDASGTLVNNADIYALEDLRRFTPQSVADWLAQWVR